MASRNPDEHAEVPFCSVLAKERYGAYQVIWVLQKVFGNFM